MVKYTETMFIFINLKNEHCIFLWMFATVNETNQKNISHSKAYPWDTCEYSGRLSFRHIPMNLLTHFGIFNGCYMVHYIETSKFVQLAPKR